MRPGGLTGSFWAIGEFIWTTQAKESTVGVLAMAGAGKGVSVLVTPTNDFSKVLSGMNGTRNPPLAS